MNKKHDFISKNPTTFNLFFNNLAAYVSKKNYFYAPYENGKAQKGPFGDVVKVIIPQVKIITVIFSAQLYICSFGLFTEWISLH